MTPGVIPSSRLAHSYRARFPHLWQGFIREIFPSARKAAQFFSVDERTSRGWWHGTHGPQGHAVGMAFVSFPDAAARHLIEVFERSLMRIARLFTRG